MENEKNKKNYKKNNCNINSYTNIFGQFKINRKK